MSGKIGVLIIHGMGSQRAGFSTDLPDELRDRVGSLEPRFEWEEIYWANELKEREDELWDCMEQAENAEQQTLDLDWIPIRKFVVHNFGDFQVICQVLGKSPAAKFDTSKPEGYPERAADVTKLRKITGFVPETKLKDGVLEIADWYQKKVKQS